MSLTLSGKKLTDTIYENIRNEIIANRIKPGEKLSDKELAAKLGVSRTPVREALIRLEREGYIITVARQGTYVNTLNKDDIREIYIIREALEAAAAQIGARIMDEDNLNYMETLVRRFDDALSAGDYDEFIKIDVAFHNLIVKSSNLKRLYDVCEQFRLQSVSILIKGENYKENLLRYTREHREVLEAFKKHDGDMAEAAIRSHIRGGKMDILANANEII